MYAITERLSDHLENAHYRVRSGEALGVPSIRFIATKTIFSFTGFGLLSINIIACEKDKAMPHDVDRLFEPGFKLAKRMNRVPLFRGLQFGYLVMPVIIGENPDKEVLFYSSSPPYCYRLAVLNFPVVVDLTDRRVVFFEGSTKWGAFVWPKAQDVVTTHIEPLIDKGF